VYKKGGSPVLDMKAIPIHSILSQFIQNGFIIVISKQFILNNSYFIKFEAKTIEMLLFSIKS
jgi:hypothetical protein